MKNLILLFIFLFLISLNSKNPILLETISERNGYQWNKFCDPEFGLLLYIEDCYRLFRYNKKCIESQYVVEEYKGTCDLPSQLQDEELKGTRKPITKLPQLPIHTLFLILKTSNCNKKYNAINKIYPNVKLSDGGVRFHIGINLKPLATNDPKKQFYDKDYILYYNNHEISFDLAIDQFNKSPFVLKDHSKAIKLSKNGDLSLEYIKIFTRKFVLNTVHEVLAFCTKNDEGDSYFFLVDRGATWNKVSTHVRFIYYAKDNNCNTENKNWPNKIDENSVFKGEGSPFENCDDNADKCDIVRSLRSVFDVLTEYVDTHSFYRLFSSNCQHFGTGLFNTLLNENQEYSNVNIDSKGERNLDHLLIDNDLIEENDEINKNEEQ